MSIEEMCIEARKKVAAHINRSAGQHLRAMKLASERRLRPRVDRVLVIDVRKLNQ